MKDVVSDCCFRGYYAYDGWPQCEGCDRPCALIREVDLEDMFLATLADGQMRTAPEIAEAAGFNREGKWLQVATILGALSWRGRVQMVYDRDSGRWMYRLPERNGHAGKDPGRADEHDRSARGAAG